MADGHDGRVGGRRAGHARRVRAVVRTGCGAVLDRHPRRRQEALSPIVPVEAEPATTRIDDGRCDAQGRFVFGTFNAELAPSGHFYRVGADLNVECLPLPFVAVANSIAFSPDGSRLYFAASPTREIHCAGYHADGRIGVSTARIGVDDETLRAQPAVGGVFALVPGRRGLPEHRFVTALRP